MRAPLFFVFLIALITTALLKGVKANVIVETVVHTGCDIYSISNTDQNTTKKVSKLCAEKSREKKNTHAQMHEKKSGIELF